MTAQVEILVDRARERPDASRCWRSSQFNGKDHVTKKVDDRFVQTEVELGVSNEKFVEVTKGLNEGDVVVMSPMSLMTDEEKRKAFGSASKGGKRDWGEDEAAEADAKGAAGGPGRGARRSPASGAPARAAMPPRPRPRARAAAWPRAREAGGGSAVFAKLKSLSRRREAQLKTAQPTKRRAEILKKAGLTDAEIEQMAEMRRAGGGGGGGGGRRRWRRRSAAAAVRAAATGREDRISESRTRARPSPPASRSSSWST